MEAPYFYIREDENRFASTGWTTGPWGPTSQHAGPPAALLGRAIEEAGHDGFLTARVTFDILRPVPIAPVEILTEVVRSGRSVELVEATMTTTDGPVMRAAAWRIRLGEVAEATTPDPAPPPPEEAHEVPVFGTEYEGYLQAMEWRFISGSFLEPGPAVGWLRMRGQLVQGEENSQLTKVLAAVDSASGISGELDFARWLFVNPELTVHLSRLPEGDWVCLDAATHIDGRGIGLARSRIFDRTSAIGRSAQSLFVSERR